MRTAHRSSVTAVLLLAMTIQTPLPAGADPLAAPAGTAADSAAIRPAAPRPDALADLRWRVGRNEARVWSGIDAWDVRGARFDSTGVVFGPDDLRGVPAWDRGGVNGDYSRPAGITSPIPWSRIDRIQVRRPSVLYGSILGGLIGTVAMASLLAWAVPDDPGPGVLVLFAIPPAGAVLGGAFGAATVRSETVWPPTPAGPSPSEHDPDSNLPPER